MNLPADDARIDLHLHTTASDGTLTPTELVRRARSLGLVAVAITDHDSIGGVGEGIEAGRAEGIEVVPGVEIGIAHDPRRGLVEIDVLGYLVDPRHAELTDVLTRLQEAKNRKLSSQIAVLAANGLPIDEDEVLAEAGGDTVRRPHIWKVLHRRHPEFPSDEFFDRTSFGGAWHVPKEMSVTLEESVALIRRAGGVSVIAHPGAYNTSFQREGKLIDPAVDAAILVALSAGIRGIEVYYTYDKNRPFHNDDPLITPDQQRTIWDHYGSLARRHGALITGGTDFHGASKPQIEIGEVDVPYHLLRALKEARG
jgi:predicted metal-dependent phosphoesterase TrpH